MSYKAKKQPEHRRFKLSEPNPGHCRYCCLPILSPFGAILTRKTWHPHCVELYKQQSWVKELRKAIQKRDKGVCAHCKTTHPDWQADHIVPLAAGGSFEHSNIQTLCPACHKLKSKSDLQTIKRFLTGKAAVSHPSPTIDQ